MRTLVPLTKMVKRGTLRDYIREAPAPVPVDPRPFWFHDEINKAIDAYEPPDEPFEDRMDLAGRSYEASGLTKICPFVAYLVSRGIGRIGQ